MSTRTRFYILIIVIHLIVGCTAVATKQDNQDFIAAYIPPFYYFMGPVIDVGEFSQGLSSNSNQELMDAINKMEVSKDILTPEQMYVASIRLYEEGAKKLAVLWFYRAYYRSQLYLFLLDEFRFGNEKMAALKKAYGDFHRQVGPYINGFAGCDPDQWIGLITQVKKENATVSNMTIFFGGDTIFIPSGKLVRANQQVTENMINLADGIASLKSLWHEKRKSNGLDERFCKKK